MAHRSGAGVVSDLEGAGSKYWSHVVVNCTLDSSDSSLQLLKLESNAARDSDSSASPSPLTTDRRLQCLPQIRRGLLSQGDPHREQKIEENRTTKPGILIPTLEEIHIHCSAGLDDNDLRRVVAACPRLRVLDPRGRDMIYVIDDSTSTSLPHW
ncbi:hypothetical protein ABZP36_021109 [Zizania latifolia]